MDDVIKETNKLLLFDPREVSFQDDFLGYTGWHFKIGGDCSMELLELSVVLVQLCMIPVINLHPKMGPSKRG